MLDPRKRGRLVPGLKFRGPTAEVRTSRMEGWSTPRSTPPIMVSPGLEPNGMGASSSARGRTSIDRRVAAGPHSLMARRTFSLFTDSHRQDLGQLEQPASARTVRRPPLLPPTSGAAPAGTPTIGAPVVMVTAARSSSSIASGSSRSEDSLPLTMDPTLNAMPKPLAQSGGCGNFLTLPLPALRCDNSADVSCTSSRPTSHSPRQSLSPPRPILRASSVSNSPRSGSAASSKRVSFAGDCKVPPPTTITELLIKLGQDESEQGIVIANREAGSGSRIGKARATEPSSDGHGLPQSVRRNALEASEVFRTSLVRCGV